MTVTSARTRTRRVDPDEVEDTAPFEVEEEDAPPARRRSRRAQQEEVDEETGDEEPEGEEIAVPFAMGRDAIRKSRANKSGDMYWRWPEAEGEGQVVKFLENEDGSIAWSYEQHWVDRGGKKSFPCIEAPGVKCPLCAIGAKVSTKVVYSVLNLSLPEPKVQALEVSSQIDDDLTGLDAGKTGPLPRLYWEVVRTKKARPTGYAKYNYTFTPIKERDLEEEYGVVLDDAEKEMKEAKFILPSRYLGKVTRQSLQEIVDQVMS
jgi:hypothetical protein